MDAYTLPGVTRCQKVFRKMQIFHADVELYKQHCIFAPVLMHHSIYSWQDLLLTTPSAIEVAHLEQVTDEKNVYAFDTKEE